MDTLRRSLFLSCLGFAFCFLTSPGNLTAQTRVQSALSYVELGDKLAQHGDFERAISSYVIALQIAPDFAPAYFKRGLARQAKGDFASAISDYSKTVAIDSRCANAFYNRGNIWLSQGELDAALSDFDHALESDP